MWIRELVVAVRNLGAESSFWEVSVAKPLFTVCKYNGHIYGMYMNRINVFLNTYY